MASPTTRSVTVTTSATLLTSGSFRRHCGVQAPAGTDVYVGGSTVTTATGLLVAAGKTLGVDGNDALYGVVAASTADVRVYEAT